MCAVSMIYDYGRTIFPVKWSEQQIGDVPLQPLEERKTIQEWLEEFEKLRKAAEEFDKRTGQPDCEDPSKLEWMKEIEQRLAKLENDKQ